MRKLSGIVTIIALASIWQIVASLKLSNLKYLPTPLNVLAAVASLVRQNAFWNATGHTILVALLGWSVACLAGIILGTAVGLSQTLQEWTLSSFDVFRSVPVIAILPVMVLLRGLTTQMELYLVAYAAFWPVLINTIGGVSSVSKALHDVTATLRLKRAAKITKIILPASGAPISVGVSLALTLSLVVAVLAEIVANPAGIGHAITTSQLALQPNIMFAYIAVTGIIGLLLSLGLQGIYRMFRPGLLEKGGTKQ